MLDPQHLRSFREIARTGSYSAAARRLGYTQPALSYQMRLLEKAVGAPLTARAGRSIRLTPAGQSLLRHADQILTAIRVAERDLAHVIGSRSGVLRIAAFSSGRATLVADALADVAVSQPALDVRLLHADPLDATAMVVRGDADLAVTYRYAVEELASIPANVRSDGTSSLRRSPLSSVGLLWDHVHLVVPRSHRLASTTVSSLAPFADERFLVGSDLFSGLLARAAARAGFVPKMMMVADDCASMQALAARGVGIALLPGLELLAVRRDDVATLAVPDWPVRQVAVESWPDLLKLPSIEPVVAALSAAADRIVDDVGPLGLVSPAAGTEHVSSHPPSTVSAIDQTWHRWYDVISTTLPRRASGRVDRGVAVTDASDSRQVHTVEGMLEGDVVGDAVTDHPGGVLMADIPVDGEEVWWFADDHGDEHGVWMRQPFAGGAATPVSDAIPPGTPAGLSFGGRRAAIGRTDREASEVYVIDLGPERRPADATSLVYRSEEYATAGPLSPDGELLAISHSEHGNSLKPAIRVLRVDRDGAPSIVAELTDGPTLGLWPVAFSPVDGSHELLVRHERGGRSRPLLWDVTTGDQREIDVPLPGEITASWYPAGDALLVLHQHRARSELYRLDLGDGSLERLETPAGYVADASALPDGRVEYLWSSASHPPAVLTTGPEPAAAQLPGLDGAPALADLNVSGADGPVHVLVARPGAAADGAAGPGPVVFLVHGGPAAHDTDAFSATRNAWVARGYTTVQVNYRGSTGYGSEWRGANIGRPGRAELEDLAAVRDALVADGTADPDRIVIAGRSWGGYLALLALGQQPGLWSLGVAIVPVADTAAVYEDMSDQLRASYRVRFGGSPTDVPEAYAAASPLTYVDDVEVPVLVTAGLRDPRCPIRQIELYVSRLVELGKQHEYRAFDRGHEVRSRSERVDEMEMVLAFVDRHLPTP